MSKKKEKKATEKPQKKNTARTELTETPERDDAALYLLQIRALEKQLEMYQRKCDELEVQKADFSSRYSQLEQEMRDMVQYLKRSVAQLEEELAAVSERLVSEQSAWEEQKRSLELQLNQLRQDHQEKSDKLSSENMVLAGKLASLEDFGEQKERLMSDLSSLEEQLASQTVEHSSAIHELVKKGLLEKERLRVEHVNQMKTAAVELQQLARADVSEGVSRCLGERDMLQGELAHLAKQNQVLDQENQTLKDTETLLHCKTHAMKSMISHLNHAKQSNLRVVQQLTDRCKQLGVELKEQSSICQGLQKTQTQHNLLLAEAKVLRQEHELVLEQGRKDALMAKHLGAELEEERHRRGQTETILQEAAVALRRALTEENKEEQEQQQEVDEEVQLVVRRNQNMQKLLAVLNRAAQLGADCGVACLVSEETPTFGRPLAHFRPGDLGLVPRPNQTSRGSKVGSQSRTTSQHPRKSSKKRSGPSTPAP